jgi:hypothetical protein
VGKYKICGCCYKAFWAKLDKKKYCSHSCSSKAVVRGAALNGPRKPDRYITKNGYVQILVDGKHVSEHKIVLESKLGRELRKGESVHHINGKRDDNGPENLELWLGGIRYGQRASDLRCLKCGEPYKVKL